jgi:hypothetical protein
VFSVAFGPARLHSTFDAMNTRRVVSFVVALCSVLIVARVCAELPATNQVVNYERCDSEWNWREVPRSEGEAVLDCLRDIGSFKTWGSTVPPGILANPIPTSVEFRVVNSFGKTNVFRFSRQGELVNCPRGLLVVPDREEKILSELLAKWGKADSTRIATQPLPCKYTIGTAEDGGTLSGIARLFYGEATQWRRIYEANKTTIKNPDIINPGTIIMIPQLQRAANMSGPANGNQPIRPETNRTSSAAGSRR